MADREIIRFRDWSSAIFSGMRVTISGGPLTEQQIDSFNLPGVFLADAESISPNEVELLLVDEHDSGLTEAQIRELLLPALERASS